MDDYYRYWWSWGRLDVQGHVQVSVRRLTMDLVKDWELRNGWRLIRRLVVRRMTETIGNSSVEKD